jgi:hypothetical protein
LPLRRTEHNRITSNVAATLVCSSCTAATKSSD